MPRRNAILRKLAVWWFLFAPVAGFAASGDEFYQRLYERGIAHYNSGDYALASSELRKAAFGFVEQLEKFETVEAFAAIAAIRAGNEADARDALLRIVAAEKVQPHFRSINLPSDLRTEIEKTAVALLTSEESRALGVSESVRSAAAAAKTPIIVPMPSKTPNVAVTAPRPSNDPDAVPPGTESRPPAPKPSSRTQQPVTPAPQPGTAPLPVARVPEPLAPTPRPAPVVPPKSATKQSPVPQPGPRVPQPAPAPRPPAPVERPPVVTAPISAPQPSMRNAEASLAEGERAVDDGDIGRARSVYNALLVGPQLPHATGLRLAEGLYRVRDFEGAARAFQRAGSIGHGEERYHYYYAVALYETSHYGAAKRELAASLPFIEVTTDVAHYRVKIEGAIE